MIRELKDWVWYFDKDNHQLVVLEKGRPTEYLVLDKVRMFSLFRFLVRIAHWAFYRRIKK